MEGSRGRKSAQKCPEFLLDLEIVRVGVAQFIVNIFCPVRKVEKTGVFLRPVSPAASNRAGYSAPIWLGVTISRESSTFLDFLDLRLLADFSMG